MAAVDSSPDRRHRGPARHQDRLGHNREPDRVGNLTPLQVILLLREAMPQKGSAPRAMGRPRLHSPLGLALRVLIHQLWVKLKEHRGTGK